MIFDKILVKSCFFGFGALTILSLLFNGGILLWGGNFMCMLTGMLCHGYKLKEFYTLDKVVVYIIGLMNIIYHHDKMDLIYKMLLYILVAVSIYSFHTIKTQEEHLMFVHIPSYLGIFLIIVAQSVN
jgi:hypothetical protein